MPLIVRMPLLMLLVCLAVFAAAVPVARSAECPEEWSVSAQIDSAGDYRVYAWWVTNPENATNAKYAINYDGGGPGLGDVIVNQRINGGQWNLLGTYPFAAGTSVRVVVCNEDADGAVIADAIKLENEGWEIDVLGTVSIELDLT